MPRTTIRSEDITDLQVKTADIDAAAITSAKIASGAVDTSGLKDDIALLAFKTQANGSLARYNLVDQFVDAFEDASGVDASTSTNEVRNSSGNYYSGVVAVTGGTSSTYGIYTLNTFSVSGTFTTGGSGLADILVVGGGGEGGYDEGGGGGGAGGFKYWSQTTVAAAAHSIVVGTGGTGGSGNTAGGKGVNSSFASLSASEGGGGGGLHAGGPSPGSMDGGSGGGGTGRNSRAGGVASANQGFAGGAAAPGSTPNTLDSGGGGGGASAVGATATAPAGQPAGNGGAGYTEGATVYDWESGSGTVTFPSEFKVGSGGNLSYAGGGGGGSETGPAGSGGIGGGGGAEVAGTANTGGGGGGNHGSDSPHSAGSGGSGIVVIRYVTDALSANNNMTLVSTATTAESAPTKGDLVFTYTNAVGTAVLGTNITAEYSADNGSTWTDFGIGASDSQGTTGGHTIVTKNNVTLTSTSGTSMRYRIKTLVQSAALSTRIHAVSLGWA